MFKLMAAFSTAKFINWHIIDLKGFGYFLIEFNDSFQAVNVFR